MTCTEGQIASQDDRRSASSASDSAEGETSCGVACDNDGGTSGLTDTISSRSSEDSSGSGQQCRCSSSSERFCQAHDGLDLDSVCSNCCEAMIGKEAKEGSDDYTPISPEVWRMRAVQIGQGLNRNCMHAISLN